MTRSDRTDWKTLAALASLSIPLSGMTLPLLVLGPEFYANSLGFDLAVVGFAFTSVRVIDIFFDPIMGNIMDRTRSRMGRYRPWLLVGAPLLAGATAMLFFAKPGVGPPYLISGLLIAFAGWSILSLAQLSLGAGLATSYDGRSRVYSWVQAAYLLGMCIVLLLPRFLAGGKGEDAFATMAFAAWTVIGILIPSILLVLWRVPENDTPARHPPLALKLYLDIAKTHSVWRLVLADLLLGLAFGFSASLIVFYFTAVVGLGRADVSTLVVIQMGAAAVCAPLAAVFAKRMGKHRALAAYSLAATVMFASFYFTPHGSLLFAAIPMALVGVCYSGVTVLPRTMMADVVDEVRLETGQDHTALLYALLIGSFKMGGALSIGLSFLGLAILGYDAKAGGANPASVLDGVQVMYCALPIIILIAGAALAWGYPLDAAKHAAIRAELDRLDAAADEADDRALAGATAPAT